MKLSISNRIASLPTSIFTTMSRMANEYNATNLGQGFPDFDGPDWFADSIYKAVKESKNQYAPSVGIISLRKRIAEYHQKYYSLSWNHDNEITITSGATEAIYCTIQAFINPGDEVIMFEPFFDCYQSDVILAGGICRYITLRKPLFDFDFNELKSLVNNKTKMIILNSPHNPTGKVFSNEELNFISKLAIENDLLVLSDEVYEFLTFDNCKHIPIASIQGMKKRTITISSTGKTFSMTGWKIGYAIAEAKLSEAIRKVHQWVTFSVNTPAQHSMEFAFSQLDNYLPKYQKMYLDKRNLVYKKLKNSKFKLFKPYGAYFYLMEYPKEDFFSDVEAATKLVIEYGIATIPTSVFYSLSEEGKSMLRLCFAKSDDILIEGIEKLLKL